MYEMDLCCNNTDVCEMLKLSRKLVWDMVLRNKMSSCRAVNRLGSWSLETEWA